MVRSPLVVSWGGGVNSTALLAGYYQRGIRPDLVMFADTGGEKPTTYLYLRLFRAWMVQVGFPDLVVVQSAAQFKTLEEQCEVKRTLPSLAFGWKKCSDKYKVRPQNKHVNNWPPAKAAWKAGLKVTKALGIDAGETRRAKIKADKKYDYIYPLIEWGWDRDDCVEALHRAGLMVPTKSACFFCPASTKKEVVALAQHNPDLFRRAVEMERRALATGELRVIKGLGRHWAWEELVRAAREGREGDFPESIQEPCMCFDGDYDGEDPVPLDDPVIASMLEGFI